MEPTRRTGLWPRRLRVLCRRMHGIPDRDAQHVGIRFDDLPDCVLGWVGSINGQVGCETSGNKRRADLDLPRHVSESLPSMRILWHWYTLGPYHFARMNALARQPGVELTVIETAPCDDHGWKRVDSIA